MDKEVMQMALDALEAEHSAIYGTSKTAKAIDALRAALAQPEPEPVAKNEGGKITWLVDKWPQNCLLYTTLPISKSGDKKWIDEPQKVSAGAASPMLFTYEQVKAHIKAALMSNNNVNVGDDVTKDGVSVVVRKNTEVLHAKFYPFPPQREFIGLTDEERSEILLDFLCDPSTEHIRDIEAKLKEKNHGV